MQFSEKLSSLRRRKGYSQEQLADRLGVTRQSVSKWESGAAMPELSKLITLSEVFGVSVDYLVKDYTTEVPEIDPLRDTARLEAKVDDLSRQVDPRIYQFTSRTRFLGLPLVSVRFSRDRGPTRSSTAVGVIAVGNFAVGIVSIGLISVGLLSVGMIALGALALGGVSVGIVALGASAIGIYAAGAAAVGKEIAVGTAAVGGTAVGLDADGTHIMLRQADTSAGEIAQFIGRYHPRLWRPLMWLLTRLGTL